MIKWFTSKNHEKKEDKNLELTESEDTGSEDCCENWNNKTIISVEDVSKSFGDKIVLSNLSFSICKGENFVIMGRSGCGKSVLLKLITGLMKPDSGKIWVDGHEITKLKETKINKIRTNWGMLFQHSALFDSMTVEENVSFMLRQHTKLEEEKIRQIVAEKLELVKLSDTEKLKPAELSGGMKKRVGLARAIAMEPQIIFYDEPTTGLDPITANEINHLIKDLDEKMGVTSVIVTHDMKSAFFLANRGIMLYNDKIIEKGTMEEIRNSQNPIVQDFIDKQIG